MLLEELVSAELECALQEVAGECWACAGQEGAGAFICDDLAEAADEAAVVGYWVELDAGFDAGRGLAIDLPLRSALRILTRQRV